MNEEMSKFILENYQNMSRKEIAEHFGISSESVKSKIYRLRKQGELNFLKPQKTLYTDEINSFLLNNYTNYTYGRLAELVTEIFGTKFTLRGIGTQVQKLKREAKLPRKPGIKSKKIVEKKEKKIPMREQISEEQNAWFRENHIKYHFAELTKMFNEKFNCNYKESSIAYYCCCILGLRAKQEDKQCYQCAVSKPVGSERINEKGNVEIKLENGKWVLKHRFMWEKYHNKEVPDRSYVIFLDGDKNNFSKENLVCLPDVIQGHLSSIPVECVKLKKCKIANAVLEQILKKVECLDEKSLG